MWSKIKSEINQRTIKKLFGKIYLSGIKDWSEEDQEEVQKLIKDFGFLFALNDLDLGKTSTVKHAIKHTDYTPFKERYCMIPPHQFEEVRKHLQEMFKIGAIQHSNSPWASVVVLVQKKMSLRLSIDLRKFNVCTVKDTYSLSRLTETLDSLNGAHWFMSLDLKAGYAQVELDEDSKPLTAFTMEPLGFYECKRMLFGLTNAPATFQHLMEICLGELHLQWCIIY